MKIRILFKNYFIKYNKENKFIGNFDTLKFFVQIIISEMDTSFDEDYYGILKISTNASASEIKKAFRSRSLETHPDKNPDNANAEKEFLLVTKAYQILSDDKAKNAYDAVIKLRMARKRKNDAMDAQRKKMKVDLETKESESRQLREEKAKKQFQRELERIKEANLKMKENYQEKFQKEVLIQQDQIKKKENESNSTSTPTEEVKPPSTVSGKEFKAFENDILARMMSFQKKQ